MSLVNVRNCIRFYQTAEELNASTLMNYCAEIIASHWVRIERCGQSEIQCKPCFCSRPSGTSPLQLALLKKKQFDGWSVRFVSVLKVF